MAVEMMGGSVSTMTGRPLDVIDDDCAMASVENAKRQSRVNNIVVAVGMRARSDVERVLWMPNVQQWRRSLIKESLQSSTVLMASFGSQDLKSQMRAQ